MVTFFQMFIPFAPLLWVGVMLLVGVSDQDISDLPLRRGKLGLP